MTDHPRLLLVHAHPDDETLTTGATMARAVDEGVAVTLVTCTRGELGAVVPEDLRHLRGAPEALAEHRMAELAAAMAVLGVRDHRFLGADAGVRYRDSGMVSGPGGLATTPPDLADDAFAAADVDAAATHLARVLREVRPHAVVTYERTGGYGHPDHVMAHRVALRATDLAATGVDGMPGWDVPATYAIVLPRSTVLDALRALVRAGAPAIDPDGPLPGMIVDDDLVTTVVDAPDCWQRKAEALQAHRSQLTVDLVAGTTVQDDGMPFPILATEWYQRLQGAAPGPAADGDRATDPLSRLLVHV